MVKWFLSAIIALALIAGIGYAAMSVGIVTLGSPTERSVQTAQATSTRTLTDIMAEGGNYVCTFTAENASATSSGTIYISGENVRGDFVSMIDASKMLGIQSHIVQYGGYTYTWSEGMPLGAKVPRDRVQTATSTTNMSGVGQGFDMNAFRAYTCEEWIPDLTKYDLPEDVTFTSTQ